MKIPVILLNYNSSADCRKCVKFLKRQEGVELEIVIVDNCSPREGEQESIKYLCEEQGCTFLAASKNRGYNAGNNIGLHYATEKGYKYALIANPDMEFPSVDYISRLVSKMSENENIVIVASDIIGIDKQHQNPMHRDESFRDCLGWIKTSFNKKQTGVSDSLDNYRKSHFCSKVSGCCFLICLDFVQSIGYFDESVFLYCEEAILSRQVEQKGLKMYYLSDIQATHAHISSAKGNPIIRFGNWKQSRKYFIDNYSGYSFIMRIIAKLSLEMYVLAYKLYKK